MTISTLDGYIAAAKQHVRITKNTTRSTTTGQWFSMFDLGGAPGAGVLAGTSTTTGVVPTDATAGMPVIQAFGVGATGYLTQVEFGANAPARFRIYDLLWKGGAYAFNANTSGNTPASYASRLPDTDYSHCEIWYEQVTAGTGTQSVNVTYTNELGTTGRTTGATSLGTTGTLGRMIQLPLAAGDKGVQGVTGVVGTVASAGTFNILVMRPIWSGRARISNDGGNHGLDLVGMPIVYSDSALYPIHIADSSAGALLELKLVIANA